MQIIIWTLGVAFFDLGILLSVESLWWHLCKWNDLFLVMMKTFMQGVGILIVVLLCMQ